MKMILLTLFALSRPLGVFANVSDLETERLLNAKSANELLRVANESLELKIASAACMAQKKNETLPTQCLSAVHIETKLGLIDAASSQRALARLVDICVERAQTITSKSVLESALKLVSVQGGCRKAIMIRASELQYMHGSDF